MGTRKKHRKSSMGIVGYMVIIPLSFLASLAMYNISNNRNLFSEYDLISSIITDLSSPDVIDISDLFSHKALIEPQYIVIHHDAIQQNSDYVPIFDILENHRNERGWSTIYYNFYIAKSGQIYKLRQFDFKELSICLSGNFNVENPTDAQYNSLIKLISKLKQKNQNLTVMYHCEIDKTDCPGVRFEEKRTLLEMINKKNIFQKLKKIFNEKTIK